MVLNGKTKTYHYDWGNYLSYVEKANVSFSVFNGGDNIKKQSRKSWSRFNELMIKSIKKVNRQKKSEIL
jgi:hypothetical protein